GACVALLVPEAPEYELQVGGLDPYLAVGGLHRASPRFADVDLARDDLLQHGLDELRLDRDGAVFSHQPVVFASRLDNRRPGGVEVEVLEAQVIAEDVRNQPP